MCAHTHTPPPLFGCEGALVQLILIQKTIVLQVSNVWETLS